MTTLVNYVVFFVCLRLLNINYLISNVVSWVFAVMFAYITNKLWVFESKSWQGKTVIKELLGFVGARLFSLGVEELGLWLLIDILHMGALRLSILSLDINGNMIAKVIMQIVVIILNYVFSKLVVFKKK